MFLIKKKWMAVLLTVVVVLSLSACGGSSSSSTASDNESESGSTYPGEPISVLVPNSAGGGNDLAARTFSKMLGEQGLVDQPFTVTNKPGGGQAVGLAEYVTNNNGNPHSLYVASPPTIINHLRAEGNSPYGFENLTPLARFYSDIAILAVRTDSKYKDLKSFVEDLKKKPSQMPIVGGSGPGSQDHLTVMMLADKSGVDPNKVKYVSYSGSGEALTSLLGGNGVALSSDLSGIAEFVKAGKVRILAIASPERLDGMYKDVPTYKEQGVDLVYYNWKALFGPKDMSPEAVAFWDETLNKLVQSKEWGEYVDANGFIPNYLNHSEFKAFLEEQNTMFKDILGKLDMLK